VYWKSLDEEFDDLDHGMQYFDENKDTMSTRVYKLETNTAWAEVPPSRTRRLITNVRVKSDDGNELKVESYFLVYKSRLEHTEDTYIGERLDTLRRVGESFQIVSRVVRLDQTVVMVKNISIFL
jgi:3-phenylpropionate/cinnamic acid dioxygenase small subunit